MNRIKAGVFFIFFLLSAACIGQVKFHNITLKQGLSSNRVYDCIKDSRGFIWFATDNGICRYDGTKFKTFSNDGKSDFGLKESIFTYVYKKSEDELLFISYFGALYSYSYKAGRFLNLSEGNSALKGKHLNSLFKDKANNNWFTTEKGIIKTDAEFNLTGEYILSDTEKGASSNKALTICEDKNGLFWLGMESRSVMLFNPKTGRFSTRELPKSLPRIQQVKTIITYPNSDFVFIATAGEGLFKININTFSAERWKSVTGKPDSLPSDRIISLFPQNDSLLWAGTLDGLALINLKSGKVTSYFNNSMHPYSLVNNCVYNLYIDSQNILWVSTFGGISKLYLFPERFAKESQNIELKSSPASNKICHALKDKYGNLWLATSKGISIKEASTGKYFCYVIPVSFPTHKNQEINFFFIDGDTWWVGTWGGGLSRFKYPENFKPGMAINFKNFYFDPADPKSISSNFIKIISLDNSGNIWITTWNGGLNKINKADKEKDEITFVHFPPLPPEKGISPVTNYLAEFHIDKEDNMWFSSSAGLQRLNFSKNESEMLYPRPDKMDDLINSTVCIIEDKNNNIYHGTFKGLVKISKVNNKYIPEIIYDDKAHGIYSIIEDKKGLIWFSTLNSEIGMYDPVNKKLKFYSMIEETDGFEFYFGMPYLDKNGILYFVGHSGFLYFNPDDLHENKQIPSVYFTSVKINGEDKEIAGDVSDIKSLTLDYEQRNLYVSFASLNYIYPEKNEYKYLLEGSGNDWINIGNRDEINFANLKSGNYLLRIAASNNDGVWNYNGPSLAITVNPAIWENIYVRILGLVILGVIIYWYFSRKIKRLKQEKEIQNKFSALLIESQEKERKRLSGELHDSLGQNLLVIKNQLDLYRKDETRDEEDLDKICSIIKESITEVKSISSDLHPHQLERLGLMKALKSMINKVSDSCGIEITAYLEETGSCIGKENEINVFRIIQESLNNIVKHSGAQKALVSIRKSANGIEIIVEDFGKGYDINDRELANKLNEGLGLKSIKERVRLLEGILSVESVPGKGTKLKITVQC